MLKDLETSTRVQTLPTEKPRNARYLFIFIIVTTGVVGESEDLKQCI